MNVFDNHSDDFAVSAFAAEMKKKLSAKREEGYGGWRDPALCPKTLLWKMLRDHVEKGDPVDIANFAMMIYHREKDDA